MASGLVHSKIATQGLVVTADADGTYGVEEAALINEIKADYNTLVAAFNKFVVELQDRGLMEK